ncbi:NAD(P)/FAD-dependent oxidoreductase, partial [bacterium]
MEHTGRIAIIGAGIAGLCTAVYARKCGYEVDLFEQHERAGGLAISWRRGEYTFENSLVWLLGSRPGGLLHEQWREVFDIDALTFVDPDEYVRVETEDGDSLSMYRDIDRMEAELLRRAPGDADEIRRLASMVRRVSTSAFPDPSERWPHAFLRMLRAVPLIPSLRWWSSLTLQEYSRRINNPLLRRAIAGDESSTFSALVLVFPLVWMNDRNAGYPIGGSQAVTDPIAAQLQRLGGRLHCSASVTKILVEGDVARGVQLADGQTFAADWVVSAADGHATVYELLGGRYTDAATDALYRTRETFASYVHVALGVNRELSQHGNSTIWVPQTPIRVDPGTTLPCVTMRFFNVDPTFAPPGKTALTCVLPTRNVVYWTKLHDEDPARYNAEKERVAQAVIASLEHAIPGIREAVDVVDVATPATVIHYTRNWKGSMEGWLPAPGTSMTLPNTLPRLRGFYMAGQWVTPGGGFPSGLMSARRALR